MSKHNCNFQQFSLINGVGSLQATGFHKRTEAKVIMPRKSTCPHTKRFYRRLCIKSELACCSKLHSIRARVPFILDDLNKSVFPGVNQKCSITTPHFIFHFGPSEIIRCHCLQSPPTCNILLRKIV